MKTKLILALTILLLLSSCSTWTRVAHRQKQLMLIHQRKIGMRHDGVYSVSKK